MKRVIITGATGFVGSNLTQRLVNNGHKVHLFIRKGSNLWRLRQVLDHVELHQIELNSQKELERVVKRIHPEWVFHLAAHGAYSWQTEVNSIVQTNIAGTVNLVQACLRSGFEAFINTGSSSEYGIKDHAPAETERIDPNSYYAVTKASATIFCRYASISNKLNITTLRLYSVYGPYEEPNRFVPKLIVLGMQRKLPPLVDKRISRDFIYIDDVIDAYLAAAGNKPKAFGAIYNVGTGKMTSIGQAVKLARELFNIKNQPRWQSMSNRIWDTNIWLADIRKIKNDFGWKPKYDFNQGIIETVEWFKNNPRIFQYYKNRRG